MDARERVRRALTCQRPDRIPKSLGFYPLSLPDLDPIAPEDYFGLDVRFVEFAPPPGQDDFRQYLKSLPADVHIGSPAQLRTYHEWGYHPEIEADRPLGHARSVDELAAFVFPDLTDPSRYADVVEQVARWQRAGLAVAGAPPHLGGELFEAAWRLRGFTTFLTDLAIRKPLAHYLLDQLTAMVIHSTLILARAGVDILLLDDDIAMPTGLLLSLDTWREFFRPRLSEIIRLARQAAPDLIVFYHCDGDFTELVPDLIDIGVNVINPVQPDCMDARALKREFGERLALWGTVGAARTWDYGSPELIRAEVQARIAELGPEGLLLAPAYDIDFAPFPNIAAFCAAVDKFGQL